MKMVILDPAEQRSLVRRRRAAGADRYDEVWDGVYVMSPPADLEHQKLATLLAIIIHSLIGDDAGEIFAGANVSDRVDDWKKNYRCPDLAVYLKGNPAKDQGTHWLGGPDFAVEIISRHDRTRKKLPFYSLVGTGELLVVDRRPWVLELYRRSDDAMEIVGKSDPGSSSPLSSTVLPVTFRLLPGDPRPRIEVAHADGNRIWLA